MSQCFLSQIAQLQPVMSKFESIRLEPELVRGIQTAYPTSMARNEPLRDGEVDRRDPKPPPCLICDEAPGCRQCGSLNELLSILLVSPLITPIVGPYIIPYITPFKEFRLWLK